MPDELGGIRVIRDRHTCSVAADSAESARKWEAERVRASSVFSRETRERSIDPLIAILPRDGGDFCERRDVPRRA